MCCHWHDIDTDLMQFFSFGLKVISGSAGQMYS